MRSLIRPIETRYSGCRFRSRVEARWAVFFDAVEEPWEYEIQGFALPSGPYLPDFWLPRPQLWVEVKGADETGEERTLCEELSEGTGSPVVLLTGTPGTHGMDVYAGGDWWDACHWAIGKSTTKLNLCICTPASFSGAADPSEVLSGSCISSALIRARSARFEHGEKG